MEMLDEMIRNSKFEEFIWFLNGNNDQKDSILNFVFKFPSTKIKNENFFDFFLFKSVCFQLFGYHKEEANHFKFKNNF